MQIEYEATFPKIDKDSIRNTLKEAGAKLDRSEYLQKGQSLIYLQETKLLEDMSE